VLQISQVKQLPFLSLHYTCSFIIEN
jgi:hypothetical protein